MNKHFSKEDIHGQQVHEKVLNITNSQGDANGNYNEVTVYSFYSGYYQKPKKLEI